MRNRLDPTSPIPLYWQLAEALRYRVATGELTPGERLPSLREAARRWDINMHTVRRAYAELAERGFIEVRPRSGAVVLERSDGTDGFEAWLRRVAREAGKRWGVSPRDLGAALAELTEGDRPADSLLVVECSESQAADLARQLSDRWRITTRPWSLEREGEPPEEALLVATYFHYNDIRVRWPRRFPRVRFVATHPDPDLRGRLEHLRGNSDGEGFRGLGQAEPLPVVLWERDEQMARNISADLVRILPEEAFSVSHRVGRPPPMAGDPTGEVPGGAAGALLFSPRTWAELPEETRCRRDFLEVRYVFEPADLERLARELGWKPR